MIIPVRNNLLDRMKVFIGNLRWSLWMLRLRVEIGIGYAFLWIFDRREYKRLRRVESSALRKFKKFMMRGINPALYVGKDIYDDFAKKEGLRTW